MNYEVKVIKLLDFGAVVEYLEAPGNEVLLHISELAWERTNNVTDVVNLGDRKALLPRPERTERPDRKEGGDRNHNKRDDRKPRNDNK